MLGTRVGDWEKVGARVGARVGACVGDMENVGITVGTGVGSLVGDIENVGVRVVGADEVGLNVGLSDEVQHTLLVLTTSVVSQVDDKILA